MLRNTLIKKYVGMGAIFFLAMPFSHAAQPKYTITPVISAGSNQTPNVISLLLNATVTFQYRVYNNTKRLSPPLFMKSSIPGLTQVTTDNNVCGNPFQLLPGANCILSLQMNAK